MAGHLRLATVLLMGFGPVGGQCFGVRRELVAERVHPATSAPRRGSSVGLLEARRPAAPNEDRILDRQEAPASARERRFLVARPHRPASARVHVPAR